MTKLQSNIRDFMIKAGQIVRDKPSTLSKEEAELRVKLVFEEAFEFAKALNVCIDYDYTSDEPFSFKAGLEINQNLVEAADAIADLNYVVNGSAVALGIDVRLLRSRPLFPR